MSHPPPALARLALALSLVVLGLGLAGCTRRATQLLAVIETDADASFYDCVRIEVVRFPRDTPPRGASLGLLAPAQVTLPFSTGIVPPDGDARARVEVVAELRNDSCAERAPGEAPPRVSRTVRTGFLPEQTLRLPIFLADRCRDVLCSNEETCDGATGTCVLIPDVDPSSLEPVRPGEELVDAGPRPADTGAPVDAARVPTDAPLTSTCSWMGTEEGRNPNGDILSFGLTQSADGSRGARAVVFGNGMGGIDGSGESLGSGFFAIGCSGPTGIALLDDGSRGAYVGIHASRGLLVDTFVRGPSGAYVQLGGGACPTSRCIVEHAGHYVVLQGPANLRLREVNTDATLGTTVTVASSTTNGAIRATPSGLLVTFSMGGACTVQRWTTLTAAEASFTVPDCIWPDAAELADGRVAVAWRAASHQLHVGLSDAGLTMLASDEVLDATQSAARPVEVHATATGFRVTWVDDLPTPMIRSVAFDAAATPLVIHCAAGVGHAITDYQSFHTVRRGPNSAVEWPFMAQIFGVTWSDG